MPRSEAISHYSYYWLSSVLHSSFFTIAGGAFVGLFTLGVCQTGRNKNEIPDYALSLMVSAVIVAAVIRLSGVLTNYPAVFKPEGDCKPSTESPEAPTAKYTFFQGMQLLLPSLGKDMIIFPIVTYLLAVVVIGNLLKDDATLDLRASVYVLMITFSGIRQIDCMCTFFGKRAQWQKPNSDIVAVAEKPSFFSTYSTRVVKAMKQGRPELVLNTGILLYIMLMKYILMTYRNNQVMIIGFSILSLIFRCGAQRLVAILFMPGGRLDGVVDYAFLRKSISITSIVLQTLIRITFSLFCTQSAVVLTVVGFIFGEIAARGSIAMVLYFETRQWHECLVGEKAQAKIDCEKRISLHLEEIEADMKGEYVAIFSALILEVMFAEYSNFALRTELTNEVVIKLMTTTLIQFVGELISDGVSMYLEAYALSYYLVTHIEQTRAKRKGPALTRNCIAFYVGAINVFICFIVIVGSFEKSSC